MDAEIRERQQRLSLSSSLPTVPASEPFPPLLEGEQSPFSFQRNQTDQERTNAPDVPNKRGFPAYGSAPGANEKGRSIRFVQTPNGYLPVLSQGNDSDVARKDTAKRSGYPSPPRLQTLAKPAHKQDKPLPRQKQTQQEEDDA